MLCNSTMALRQGLATRGLATTASPYPVELGFVQSFARPGGNITGTTWTGSEMTGKILELLKEAAPGATRVARTIGNEPRQLRSNCYATQRAAHQAAGGRGHVAERRSRRAPGHDHEHVIRCNQERRRERTARCLGRVPLGSAARPIRPDRGCDAVPCQGRRSSADARGGLRVTGDGDRASHRGRLRVGRPAQAGCVGQRRAGGRADSGIGRPDRVRQRAGAALPADYVGGTLAPAPDEVTWRPRRGCAAFASISTGPRTTGNEATGARDPNLASVSSPRAACAGLIDAIAYQSPQTQDLERQLVREQKRVSGLAELLRKLEVQTLTRAELDALRDELSKGLIDTGERVRALEASSAAVSQIIARSSASAAFVQGSFGFEDPATKRPLRFAVRLRRGIKRTPAPFPSLRDWYRTLPS
jgi:hypothetical protein